MNPTPTPTDDELKLIKQLESLRESCPAHGIIASGMGI